MRDQLTEMIQPVVEGMGCELWGIERESSGLNSIIKVYIDAERGVDIEDCARISRQVSSLLDVEEPLLGGYTLEVSSPGMDRKLFRLDQFAAFEGAMVRILLNTAFDGRRKYSGLLRGVDGDEIILLIDDAEILFPIEVIEKANVVPKF